MNITANLTFGLWSPADSNSSDSECGENRLCDRNVGLTYSKVRGVLDLLCVIYLGPKLLRCLLHEDWMNTATTWVGWHGSREHALLYWLIWPGGSTEIGQREEGKGGGISLGFHYLPFPIKSTYILKLFRHCAFDMWQFRALTIWFCRWF